MNVNYECKASEQSIQILLALETAVSNALDKKQKLGQYAVIWDRKKNIVKQTDVNLPLLP